MRQHFPIFASNESLVYLDTAATSLKPQIVIDAVEDYYKNYSANIHRGLYEISEKATEKVEQVREKIARQINAKPNEIIFTKGTTEGLNLVASGYLSQLTKGAEVVTTVIDHHSSFVPFQQFAKIYGHTFKVVEWDLEHTTEDEIIVAFQNVICDKTAVLSLPYVSNVLGIELPISKIVSFAKHINPDIKIVLDAAQAASHIKMDVKELGCDAIAWSGHKMYGPTGVGVLYLEGVFAQQISPYQYGGQMISTVKIEDSSFREAPYKFEAGTLPIAEIIGLGAAYDFMNEVGYEVIESHLQSVSNYVITELQRNFGSEIKVYAGGKNAFIVSFNHNSIHPHDIAQSLGSDGICVRAGHHCAAPLHQKLCISASVRVSVGLYNTKEDVDKLVLSLKKIIVIFAKK